MPTASDRYETPKWRTLGLLLGFGILVGIGVVTVVIPELEDEPSEKVSPEDADAETGEPDEALQE